MKYLSLIKSSAAYRSLYKDVKADKLNHAYLVTVNDEEILKAFFTAAACLIFCPNDCCLECNTCLKVINGNYADIRYIKPDPDSKNLKVKNLDGLFDSLLVSSIEKTGKKLYFIYSGDRISPAIQNKLLKTLEEPPASAIIFIGTASESSILDTVKSRSRKLYIDTLDTEDIYRELSQIYGKGDNVKAAALASGGHINIAERLLGDEDFIESYTEIWNMLRDLSSSSDVIDYITKPFMSKERLPDALNIMEMAFRDALAYKSGINTKSVQKKAHLDIISENYTVEAMVKAIDLIITAKEKLSFFCNVMNVGDNLLMSILEVRYKCRK